MMFFLLIYKKINSFFKTVFGVGQVLRFATVFGFVFVNGTKRKPVERADQPTCKMLLRKLAAATARVFAGALAGYVRAAVKTSKKGSRFLQEDEGKKKPL